MAACAITMVKHMVIEKFHFFNFSMNLVSQGMVLGAFFVTFDDLWGTFSDF